MNVKYYKQTLNPYATGTQSYTAWEKGFIDATNTLHGLNWVLVSEKLPEKEGYYKVRFGDGTEDEKPFRIRPSKNIHGFMTENIVVAWKEIIDPLSGKELIVWNSCVDAAITKAKLASTVIDKTKIFEFVQKLEALKL